LTGKLNYGKLN